MAPTQHANLQSELDGIFSASIPSKLLYDLQKTDLTRYSDSFSAVLLQFLCHLTGNDTIKYILYEGAALPEPVTIFIDEDKEDDDENFVIFAICPSQVALTFFDNTTSNVQCDTSLGSRNNLKLSYPLSILLLQLYVIAEHTLYHYLMYVQNKTLDYLHEKYSSKGLLLHDLISTKPEEKNQLFLEYSAQHQPSKLTYAI